MDENYVKVIATLESDIKHINLMLANINTSIEKLQGLMTEQYDLRKDVSILLTEQEKMKKSIATLSSDLLSVKDEVKNTNRKMEDMPKNLKVNVFDYLWKYLLLALGGWLTIRFTGFLPK